MKTAFISSSDLTLTMMELLVRLTLVQC